MATEWFYTQDGAKCGPVDSATLKALARTGILKPDDLLWKEGMAEWKPAAASAKLFEGNRSKQSVAASPSQIDDTSVAISEAEQQEPVKPKSTHEFRRVVVLTVVLGAAAATGIHAMQWLLGWGVGSLWAVLSSVVILSCGLFPWIWDQDKPKRRAAAFGAALGVVLGAGYGWFTGGLLSGLLFCCGIGSWAAWFANLRGLTTQAAQAGVVASTLVAFHVFGMLPPSSSERAAGSSALSSGTHDFRPRIETAKQIDIGTEWGAVVAAIGMPFHKDYANQDQFVGKWEAGPDREKSFIAIEFLKLPGRPGLRTVMVRAVAIYINGKQIYAAP